MIYWFTGQPSHGKTVLAKKLMTYYEQYRVRKQIYHVDGDNLRALTLNKDYSTQGRIDNVKGAQKIAHYLHNEGCDVVVSLVSPYRWQREELKTMLKSDIIEFYVHTNSPRERDVYKVDDYEPPLQNYIDVDTTQDTPDQSFDIILAAIYGKKEYNIL